MCEDLGEPPCSQEVSHRIVSKVEKSPTGARDEAVIPSYHQGNTAIL